MKLAINTVLVKLTGKTDDEYNFACAVNGIEDEQNTFTIKIFDNGGSIDFDHGKEFAYRGNHLDPHDYLENRYMGIADDALFSGAYSILDSLETDSPIESYDNTFDR